MERNTNTKGIVKNPFSFFKLLLPFILLLLMVSGASASFTISGMKFNDTNANGVKDIGEPGLYGISVDVFAFSGSQWNAITDINGNYTINVTEGAQVYIVVENNALLPPGCTQTYPPDPNAYYIHNLNGIENVTGDDFGNTGTCTMPPPSFDPSGYVNDSNGNALENAKVVLSNATYSDTVYTDSTGLYNATIYANGTYNYNVTKTGFTTLSGSQEFTIGGTAYNFTLSPSAGQLYGTVYEWTNGTIPNHVSFDIKEYNKVSLNPNQSDGSRLVYVGSTFTWFGGYVWKVQDIDSANSQAYIKLFYNGSEISAGIVNKGEQASVVVYEDFDEVIYLTLDVINVFSGREANTAWVKPGQKLKVKTTWEKILRSITYRYANAITEYIYGSAQTNLELWLEMKADKQEDLEAHPPTADNPCGGTYQTYGGTIDEYYNAVLPFNPDATYNLVDASFKMAAPSGQGKIGYAFTDDDITYPEGTTFPESGYQWITGISSCNIYPTTSDNFNNLDANGNKQIKIWFKMSSGNMFLLYNAYASASCVDCNKKPLSGASIYYNYLAKTYQTVTDLFGNYNLSIPFTTQLVRYTKSGYENKNNTFIFNATNNVQEYDVIINKSISNDTKVDEAIWVLPNVITKGQSWAIYYRTLNKYSDYQIITQRFGTDDNLETFDINPNTESFINMGTYQPGYYVAMLRGACWYCSWGVIASTNFTVRSAIPSVFWHSSEYYLGSVMKLGIDIPAGGANANVTAYYPNGSILYLQEHSAAEGIQTILFNTSFGGDYPPGKYIAEIEGNTNQSTTTLYNINLTNYSLEAPSSVVWGKTVIIKFLSPLQSELHIYKSDGTEAIKSFVVQSSGSYSFNTSRLENKADTLTVKLIQNNVEKATISITITQGALPSNWGDSATKGTEAYSVAQLDNYVGTMGYGINNMTRFLFSVLVIIFVVVLTLLVSKGNTDVAVTMGFLPFAFFTLISFSEGARAAGIEFLPKWPAVIFIILVALSVKIFR